MNKLYRRVLIFNCVLVIWFFLDMVGFAVKGNVLVSRSWEDDLIFMVILILVELVFLTKREIGKYVLMVWLLMWAGSQFYFHWWVTIVGPWEGKNEYFANTIKLINSPVRYVPDLYHIILHLLIVAALIVTVGYVGRSRGIDA